MRRTLRILASFVLVALLSPAWAWLDARLTRELYRMAEAIGFVGGMNRYWGQIHGHNIPMAPDPVRWSFFGIAGGAAAIPFVVAGIVVALGLRRCKPPPAVPTWARLGAVCAVLVLWSAFASQWVLERASLLALSAGEAAGCEVTRISGYVFRGADGPFNGGPGHTFFNGLYSWAPARADALGGAFALALGVYAALRARKKWMNDRPRCAGCGYPLEGLEDHACPECGSSVRAPVASG